MTAKELRRLLLETGVPEAAIHLKAESFVMAPPEWVTERLGHALDDFYFDTGIQPVDEQFDCTTYTLFAVAWSKPCWALTQPGREAALAFGLFDCLAVLHTVCIAVHRDGNGQLYPAWYEGTPSVKAGTQAFRLVTMLPKPMTKEYIESCVSCAFF